MTPTARPVCMIIPAYNTAKTVGTVVREVRARHIDPIVINDGSSDDTAWTAIDAGAFVISHVANRGKGMALRTGFQYALQAGYPLIGTMDSDGQHAPADLPALCEAMGDSTAAIVVGRRLLQPGRMPWARRVTNRLMSSTISRVAGQPIPDSQCGFRLIRSSVLRSVHLSTSRYDLESELLLAAARQGWRIVSIPVRTIYQQQRSYIRPLTDGVRFFWLVGRFALRGRPSALRRSLAESQVPSTPVMAGSLNDPSALTGAAAGDSRA